MIKGKPFFIRINGMRWCYRNALESKSMLASSRVDLRRIGIQSKSSGE